jgi:hypothetical protein
VITAKMVKNVIYQRSIPGPKMRQTKLLTCLLASRLCMVAKAIRYATWIKLINNILS